MTILREIAALAAVAGFCLAVCNLAQVLGPLMERMPG